MLVQVLALVLSLNYITPCSSQQVMLLSVHTKSRDLWEGPTAEVCNSLTTCHSAHVHSRV